MSAFVIPVPKYKIGDSVWGAGFSAHTQIREACPDCLGLLEWTATLPSGDKFQIPCGTCMDGYFCTGSIVRWGPSQSAQRLTIGSVRLNTEDTPPVSYMCVETGFGSGSVWNEDRVFDTEAEALARSAAEGRKHADAMTKQNEDHRERERKKHRSKPTFEQRRIKDLEKQLAALTTRVSP